MRHLGAWLCWWTILFFGWLLLAGDWNGIELVAAACAATVAATAGELARAAVDLPARVPLRALRRAASVPPWIVVDFGIITWALLAGAARGRVRRGSFRSRPFAEPATAAAARGLRAYVTVAATFSPNAYVVSIDDGEVRLHDLIPVRGSESPA